MAIGNNLDLRRPLLFVRPESGKRWLLVGEITSAEASGVTNPAGNLSSILEPWRTFLSNNPQASLVEVGTSSRRNGNGK